MKPKVKRLAAIACLVFLVSIFFPFLQATWRFSDIQSIHGPENRWSFKVTGDYWNIHLGRELIVYEYWFLDYWFPPFPHLEEYQRLAGPVLVLILASQILVLLFSTSAILLDKDQLLLYSVILNTVVLLGMSLHAYTLRRYYYYNTYPAIGFWLTVLAAGLFAVAFNMSRKP